MVDGGFEREVSVIAAGEMIVMSTSRGAAAAAAENAAHPAPPTDPIGRIGRLEGMLDQRRRPRLSKLVPDIRATTTPRVCAACGLSSVDGDRKRRDLFHPTLMRHR
jgi:hypothetical protein